MKKRNEELKMMFLSFAGGYILGKSGILDDPALGKVIGGIEGLDGWRYKN